MKKAAFLFLIALLSITPNSCSKLLYMRIYNNADKDISIRTRTELVHIGKASYGRVKCEWNFQILYEHDAFDYRLKHLPGKRYYIEHAFSGEFKCQYEGDGRIYILLPDEPCPGEDFGIQPDGFPLVPYDRS
jgi:hypothetical protein